MEFRIWNPESRKGLQFVSRRQVFHLNPSLVSNTELQIDLNAAYLGADTHLEYSDPSSHPRRDHHRFTPSTKVLACFHWSLPPWSRHRMRSKTRPRDYGGQPGTRYVDARVCASVGPLPVGNTPRVPCLRSYLRYPACFITRSACAWFAFKVWSSAVLPATTPAMF